MKNVEIAEHVAAEVRKVLEEYLGNVQKPEPEPEPDPVLDSSLYISLIGAGLKHDHAYAIAEQHMEPDSLTDTPLPRAEVATIEIPEDSPASRMQKVCYALGVAPEPGDLETWKQLEAFENRQTKTGERDAFMGIYPAICSMAKNYQGMSLAKYISMKHVRKMEAPWDRGVPVDNNQDGELQTEIDSMLAELNQYSTRPDCQVGPRTKETTDDGAIYESLPAYHSRVKSRYQQMKRLINQGVIEA